MFYTKKKKQIILYDRFLLWLFFTLIVIGLITVSSSSIYISNNINKDPFFFAKKEAIILSSTCFMSLIVLYFPINIWNKKSIIVLLLSILMLLISLILGTTVNGASRWINFGFFYIQPSEFSKLSLFFYISNYLSRKIKEINTTLWSFLKPMSITLILSILLIIQPDFGTVIILFITTLTILFIAGAKLAHLFLIILSNIFFILLLIIISPYRLRRIISFWNPWLDPFDKGYQLINSLIAFGRGSFWGQGLGNSVQKLNYLPESHTDFIFSIIAEEMGYIGIIIILLMIFFYL